MASHGTLLRLRRWLAGRVGRRNIGLAAAAGALTLGASCLVAPPPEVQEPAIRRPIILADNAYPPTNALLGSLPSMGFSVYVEVDEPSTSAWWVVVVDGSYSIPQLIPVTGISEVQFTLPALSPDSCHTIELLVAHAFESVTSGQTSQYVPDSVGGDDVTWFYLPEGIPNGCPSYPALGPDSGVGPIGTASDAASDGQVP